MDEGASHYTGLVAETYDLWFGEEPFADEAFFRGLVEDGGEPALEVGCGTGRLLLPYLEAGLDVEGVDASEEMLAICRRKAEERGLEPTLHLQRMEALNLSRRYRTLFVPWGTFQAVVDRAAAAGTLERFHRHLEPGGRLAVALFVPRGELDRLRRWRIRRVAERADGATVLFHEAVEYDLTEQVQTDWYRYEVVEDGRVVASETRRMRQRWYHKHELSLLLERAGFVGMRTWGDYSEEPFSDRHSAMIVTARRPG